MTFIIFILVFFTLLICRCPIFLNMLLTSFVYLLFNGIPLSIIIERISVGISSFPLVAIPLFLLAGQIMNTGGISKRIFDFCWILVKHTKGGLAYVNVMASMIFAGMSGSSVADAGGLGAVEIEAMRKQNYSPAYSAAITAASSTIGPIIPPSIIMIILGTATQVSIGKLFVAGFIPGILMGLSMMVVIYIDSSIHKNWFPEKEKRSTVGEIWTSFKKSFFAILSPLIVLGGILAGVVTPTEAGAIAVFYSILISLFIYKDIRIKDLLIIIKQTAFYLGVVMSIVAAAQIFAWAITTENIARVTCEYIFQFFTQKWQILILMNIFLLIMGFFLEGITIIMITVPILFPIANALQLDPIHFGIILCVNVMIGLLTPPVGVSVYITSKIAKVPVHMVFQKVFPFIIILVLTLLLVTFIPEITLTLPKIVFG